jgi:hypothetical protein
MKKTFNLQIAEPCHEDFNKMAVTKNGSYCDSCSKNVIDLSNKTDYEIGKFISETKDKSSICARLDVKQLETDFSYFTPERNNPMKYVATIAATVLLSSTMTGQRKTPPQTVQTEPKCHDRIIGKIAMPKTVNRIISFTLKGKLINSNTKNPLSAKLYPNQSLYINGNTAKINTKTGDFEIPLQLNSGTSTISVYIYNDDLTFSKEISINLKAIKNNELYQNITIDPKEFRQSKVAGGLGVIFQDDKKALKNS